MNEFKWKNNKALDLCKLKIPGERIDLLSLHEKYANDIFKEFTEEITTYMIPKSPDKMDETLDFINSSIKGMKDNTNLALVIANKQDKFLGCCGLHPRGKANTPELGIWLKKSAHGFNYGFETVELLLSWARENIIFDHAIYPVDKNNIPSRRIPERLGGQLAGEATIETARGTLLDEVIFYIPASPCIFCQIVNKQAPASVIYENEDLSCFMTLRPTRPGECLIIPKEHIDHFTDIPDDLAADMMRLAQKIGRVLRKLYGNHRTGMVVHGFGVAHAHLIILPQHDPNDITSARYSQVVDGQICYDETLVDVLSREELDKHAESIRNALNTPI